MVSPLRLEQLRAERLNALAQVDPMGGYWAAGYNAAGSHLMWSTIEHLMALRRQWAVPGAAAAALPQVERVSGLTMTEAQALAWLDGVEAVGRLV